MQRRVPTLCHLGAVALLLCGLPGCGDREAAPPPSLTDPATRRAPPVGEVIGFQGRYGAHAWLGLPYARPPLGDLRWRAPEPLPPWPGEREALAHGEPCPQYASVFGGVKGGPGTIAGSEDCLTLNIFAPPLAPDALPRGDARLPVMVWIHGGGNSIGTASFYEGGNLAATHGLVIVTVQYRLGPFGWLRHPALRADAASEVEASGNFATLDLVRALTWVRDNISAFGGDPGNVTIFGESAGGQNVYTLLLAPQAKGLFQRAISQSGGLWPSDPGEAERLLDDPEPGDPQSSSEILLRLLQQDGARDRDAAKARLAGTSDAEIAAFLRSRSMVQIMRAYVSEGSGVIRMPKLFADGSVLPADDTKTRFTRSDGWNRVPVILGTNRDEDRLFLFPDPTHVTRRFWIFPRFVDEQRTLAIADHLSRMWKATGADGPAAAMRSNEPRVFVYRFDWDEEPTVLGADLSKMLGAAHGFEIPFVFGHFDLGKAGNRIFTDENLAGREALAQAMMSYWAAFARAGDPGRGVGEDLPAWTAWDATSAEAPKYLVLDTPSDGGIRMASEIETPEKVIASVASDPRLPTAAQRCDVLRALAVRARGFTPEDYAAHPECQEFPLDTAAGR